MEENKKTPVENNGPASKPTYEQLSQYAALLQKKYAELEARLQQTEIVFTRLNYLFNVLDRAQYFSDDFVEACAVEIQEIIDTRNSDTEAEE